MGKYRQESESSLRDDAWIGDAVLSIYLRSLLLQNNVEPASLRSEIFKYFSSNAFLNSFGRPTAMEAEIGIVYRESGLDAAFAFIEKKYFAVIKKQLLNRCFSEKKVNLTAGILVRPTQASVLELPV